MTTEDTPVTETAAAPIVDMSAAAQEARSKQDYEENVALIASMEKRREEEAKVAAEQDAALEAVRKACDEQRSALQSN
jgi:hypothetical protein